MKTSRGSTTRPSFGGKQLFGVMRKGKRVGGAIRKLEKLLRANGIAFE